MQPFGVPRLREFFGIDIDAERVRAQRTKLVGVSADSAADIQDARTVETNKAANQIQPPVLSKAPDVRWMTQVNRFVVDAHSK